VLVAKAVRIDATQLKPAQQRALDALGSADARDLTRARYQELTGVSRSQAAYDLAELVEAGLLVRIGAGRATRYRLASAATDSSRRRWTDGRIRAELSAFCSGRTTWPSAAEFRQAGRSDLYVAASRYGGIGFWAAELGFPPLERRRATTRARAFPRRAVLAIAAALVFALGAGAGWLALRSDRDAAPPPPKPARVPGAAPASFLRDVRSLRQARVAGFAAQVAAERRASSRVALVLRASRGDSWISVRSATGRLLVERTLAAGTALRLHGSALWVRLGTAANVDLVTNGSHSHPLPSRAAVVVVTPRGMRVTEWAPVETAPQLAVSRVAPPPPPPPAAPPPAAPAPLPKPAKAAPAPPPPPPSTPARSGSGWPAPLPPP
jgi:hypothetical protein